MPKPGLILLLQWPRLVQQAPKLERPERGRHRQHLLDDVNPRRLHAMLTIALVQVRARTRRPLVVVGQALTLMSMRPCLTLPAPARAFSAPVLALGGR